ncbi:methyltransferase domain-containing protein [Deltaproteobacteria bacterium TL4]
MRNIILSDEFHQSDFKPSAFFQKFLELTEQDVQKFFLQSGGLKERNCPVCGPTESTKAFSKFGMSYQECLSCKSLWISPSPTESQIIQYYEQSASEQYWRTELSQATEEKRQLKIVKPRLQWIVEASLEYFPEGRHIADAYTNYKGYAEAIAKESNFHKKTLLHPFLRLNDLEDIEGIEVVRQPLHELGWDGQVDVLTLFEVINRTSDINALLKTAYKMLSKGGLCFITTILSSGFDLQVLWNKAENIFPPDWLNVFSVEGLNLLFKQHGFECLEFSTPGILDMEIVNRMMEQNSTLEIPRFIRYMLQRNDSDLHQSFQKFLQANRLSSYGRILLQKKC